MISNDTRLELAIAFAHPVVADIISRNSGVGLLVGSVGFIVYSWAGENHICGVDARAVTGITSRAAKILSILKALTLSYYW
jgi:hypothetical protein